MAEEGLATNTLNTTPSSAGAGGSKPPPEGRTKDNKEAAVTNEPAADREGHSGVCECLSLYHSVFSQLDPTQRRLAWLLAVSNILQSCVMFGESKIFGLVIDALGPAKAADADSMLPSSLEELAALWACCGLLSIGASSLICLWADRLAHTFRTQALCESFEHALRATPVFSRSESTSSSRVKTTMVDGSWKLWDICLSFLRHDLESATTMAVLLLASFAISVPLALLLTALTVVIATATNWFVQNAHRQQDHLNKLYTNESEIMGDVLANLPLVQCYDLVQQEAGRLQANETSLLQEQLPLLKYWMGVVTIARSATTVAVTCIVLAGAWLKLHGLITVGEIATFITFARMVIERLHRLAETYQRLASGVPKLKAYFALKEAACAVADDDCGSDPGRVQGFIEFDHVSFAYQDGGDASANAVCDVSFQVRAKETVALVGASGAGKSTVLRLLSRAFDCQSGAIRIDGIDIRKMQLAALRRNIGVVFQDPMLFNRSIGDNIRAGSVDADMSRVRQAAARAQALQFIEKSAQGFDTLAGEQGRGLSGGERQRVAIARALLRDAPILLLDEATSALDTGTEHLLLQALEEVAADRTTLVIAHRLSTIRKAHRIVVLDGGRVVETGTYAALAKSGGYFQRMLDAQSEGQQVFVE